MYDRLPFNDQYEIMNVLPRWAYSGSEWKEIMIDCVKIVDGIMYTNPEPEDPNLVLINEFLDI